MKKISAKELVDFIIPTKFYVSQDRTLHHYKTDFVYRWMMYTDTMLTVYATYKNNGPWVCSDLNKKQKSTDIRFICEFSKIVTSFIKNGNMQEVKFAIINECTIEDIIFSGDKIKVILMLFYCIYKIPKLQLIIKDACSDFDYFIKICKEQFDQFNFHFLLTNNYPSKLITLMLTFAKDYMTNEKKKQK